MNLTKKNCTTSYINVKFLLEQAMNAQLTMGKGKGKGKGFPLQARCGPEGG